YFDLEVSPDRRRVALLAFDGDRQPRPDGPAQGGAGTPTRTATLVLLDLADGRLRRPLAGLDVLPTLLTWSPDSEALLAYARPRGALWTDGRLQRVTADTGTAAAVGEGLEPQLSLRPELLHAGWMGRTPIAYARTRGVSGEAFEWRRLDAGGEAPTARLPRGSRDLLSVDTRGLTVRVGGAVWRVDPQGRVRRLPWRDVARASPIPDAYAPRLDAELPSGGWIEAGPAGARVRLRLTASGPASIEPSAGAPGRDLLAAASATGAALVRDTDPRGVETLSVLRPHRPPLAIAQLNAELAATDAPEIRAVRHTGPEGQPLTSWLYLPARPARAAPPPLVVRPYSGSSYPAPPPEFFGEKGFMTDLRVLVGHGFAVLVPSLPLPRDAGDPMAGLAGRILTAVDAAAADPTLAGAFDPRRLALWGHSYGGYTVMATIGQTDRFRAAVAIAGYSDMISKWATLPAVHRAATDEDLRANWSTGSVEDGQGGMRVPPWSDPQRYLRNSPLLAADRIRTPLLLAHGDQDVIPLPQSEAMFAALYRQDKDAILLTYFGEGHGLRSPGNVRDFYAKAFRFLDERLAADHASQRCAPGASGTRPCQ
ncbi:MAG TPA: prolyl oligopeptidase family serine peptidase, partial [Phenylobacterium sp.]|nr:prolyl oligopeptidase family serine peptidase [Phenylobacterium sp.]